MPTKIDWAEETWEPVQGCSKISAGCANCYAERLATGRLRRFYPDGFGTIKYRFDKLADPLRWRKPRRIFVCSRSDLFHKDVWDEWIRDLLMVMEHAAQHTYLILTKRPERMREFFKAEYGNDPVPSHIWLGVSGEDQVWANHRLDILAGINARRFVSCEPILGHLDLWPWLSCGALSWVICGGESGSGARPMHPDWVRSVRDQCREAGVPMFFKQWGAWFPRSEWEWNPELVLPDDDVSYRDSALVKVFEGIEGWEPMHLVGKKKAGCTLEGQIIQEYPAFHKSESNPRSNMIESEAHRC